MPSASLTHQVISLGRLAHRGLRAQSRLAAIVLMCLATACFSMLDTTAKYLSASAHVPVFQVIWLRFLGHVLFTLSILGPSSFRAALRSAKPGHQLLRSVFMVTGTALNFWALRYIQLDQAATIFFLSPLIVAALAGPMLGEWVGWRRLLAICAGFSGVLLVTKPGFGGIHWAVSLSFGAALTLSLYNLSTRYLARFDSANTTQVFSPLAGIVAMAPMAFLDWQTPQSLLSAGLLLSLGFWGGLGHWLLILAHERAPAPILAPFGYVNIAFVITLEMLVFWDAPSWWTLGGAAIIIASGVYLLFRERQTWRGASSGPATSATVAEG